MPVASVFTGLFLEQVVEAVESKYYPNLAPAQPFLVAEILLDSLAFLGLLILVNLLALIVYLLSTLAAPLVFWAVNGLLLGREYFQMVAMRRLGRKGAKALRARNRGQIWLVGALMAVPLTIPVVNLVVPILGIATFTHLFHRLNR
jgi:CysZ protein